jgi:hypothetical protein
MVVGFTTPCAISYCISVIDKLVGWFDGAKHHFQQCFSYIVAVSFIGGGNRKKPLTCRKSLANLIT